MNRILYSIIAWLLIMCVYLSTQAFDVSKNSNKQERTWYNQNIDGDFTFWNFTSFEIRYNARSACNARNNCGPWEEIETVRWCFWNDNQRYDYSACGWNPGDRTYSCDLWPCYSGTWRQNTVPNCTSDCWYGWWIVYGTVTCSTWREADCNPNTKPSRLSRNCSATSACPLRVDGQCGTNHDSCNRWNWQDGSDTTTQYRWTCQWSWGGNSPTCSANKPVDLCNQNKPRQPWLVSGGQRRCCEMFCSNPSTGQWLCDVSVPVPKTGGPQTYCP